MNTKIFTAKYPFSSRNCLAQKVNISKTLKQSISALPGFLMIAGAALCVEEGVFVYILYTSGGAWLIVYGFANLNRHDELTVYSPTGSIVRQSSIYHDCNALPLLRHIVEKADSQKALNEPIPIYGRIRVELHRSDDEHFASVQLFICGEADDDQSTSLSPVCVYRDEEARNIIRLLQ